MEGKNPPWKLTFEYVGKERIGRIGEYWMDEHGFLHPIIYAPTDREWPIYRIVEEQS